MTPPEFVSKWKLVSLTERSACQQHFLDLCELLGQPKPAAADPEGAWYTFERGVNKTGGGKGWADVWMRGRFGWEYKGKHKNLAEAYQQLLRYREDLENPPLLVVCDLDRFEVHTNFTGTTKKTHAFDLDSLADPENLDVLRKLFTDPDALKPGQTTEALTQDAAKRLAEFADGMRDRGIPAPDAAHFLMKLIFCMFAEDIELLPNRVFTRTIATAKSDPRRLNQLLHELFKAMTEGGYFGADEIAYFNGGLFADSESIELTQGEIAVLAKVNALDWSAVEPSIFGTLFERTLDPAKRSQIGAHYTSRADIETLLEPVMMAPLRREWAEVKAACEALLPKIRAEAKKASGQTTAKRKESKPRREFDKRIREFLERLAHVSVLDPACGSGNFLYVALHLLLGLEKEVVTYAQTQGLGLFPQVRPTQLAGIEINPYAQQLAQVVIWIGYLQWMRENGFIPPSNPVLEPIESIRRMDAILDLSDPEHPLEPEWPAAEFIVGNPPFLGDKLMRGALGDGYVDKLRMLYSARIPGQSDLCCYWFERGRQMLKHGRATRVGLLATQGIRGGANREVLKRIKRDGNIFFAESDRAWVLDGANVHVSMVGFDSGIDPQRTLDGEPVASINANLTAAADITEVRRLSENVGLAYIGTTKKASFDISGAQAESFLNSVNPHGLPNSEVLFPYVNGMSITQRMADTWIIDFGERSLEESALFQKPFEHVKEHVYPSRVNHREPRQCKSWWLLARSCPEMKAAVHNLNRFVVTPTVCKHRVFAWLSAPTEADHQLYVFASEDPCFFGIVQSRLHEVWALRLGTRLETRPRYTPTTCFETFPFPEPSDVQREAIAAAARELGALRSNWLNPPEWTREQILEFPGLAGGPWTRYVHDPDSNGIGTVRYPRLVPKDEDAAQKLKKRTLTNLYNDRPTWLDLAHRKLDEAVCAAYGWQPDLTDEQILERLLALNLERAG